MVHGTDVWREAVAYLHDIYVDVYGTDVPDSIIINGETHHPDSVSAVVQLHINDCPTLGSWTDVYRLYISNLPNFANYANTVNPQIRCTVADAIIGENRNLREIVRQFDGEADLEQAVATVANPVREAFDRKDGAVWQRCMQGFARGLSWLAGLEQLYSTPAAWIAEELGEPRRGEVDPDHVWAMAVHIFNRRGKDKLTLMGQAVTLNFLKDIGLLPFAKPDIFITKLMGKIYGAKDEKEAFFEIVGRANQAGIWPRQLDRALWLISSGKLHYMPTDIYRVAPGGSADRIETFLRRLHDAGGAPQGNGATLPA